VFAALARALSVRGLAVLSVDPTGTGDSAGDFADADWGLWCRDLEAGLHWLHEHYRSPIALIGLRLGAALALLLAARRRALIGRALLWQPVLDGEKHMTQFLRLRLAAGLGSAAPERETTALLRQTLAAGRNVEVAGYLLTPALLGAIDALRLESLVDDSAPPLGWIEAGAQADGPMTPASRRVVEAWRARGLTVTTRVVADPPFWTLPEITPAPGLVQATVDMLEAPP
jgi:exosortase A-associated hydrolase 2